MTLAFMDGFDDQLATLSKWYYNNGGTSVTNEGRFGTGAMKGDCNLRATLASGTPSSTMVAGYAVKFYKFSGTAYGDVTLEFYADSGTVLHANLTLGFGSVNCQVKRGTTNLATFGPLSENIWYWVEFKSYIHDSAGTYEVRINGVNVCSGTSADTKNAGTSSNIDTIGITGASAPGYYALIDDVYVLNTSGSTNNNFLGDCKIETIYPSGNGTNSQWTGSDGNSTDNYALVDESGSPVTTDYVATSTSGYRDTYAMGNLATSSGTVYGVQAAHYAAKSDAGASSIKPLVLSSGTYSTGTAQALSTSYSTYLQLLEQDPATATAWTISGVNAVECGVELA